MTRLWDKVHLVLHPPRSDEPDEPELSNEKQSLPFNRFVRCVNQWSDEMLYGQPGSTFDQAFCVIGAEITLKPRSKVEQGAGGGDFTRRDSS